MERILGKSVADGPPPPPTPAEKVLIESKMMQWVRCDAFVAMQIFADDAKIPDRLEDYARLMYPTYLKVNLPTWVIGASFGNRPDSPAYLLKVWPEREPVQLLQYELTDIRPVARLNYRRSRARNVPVSSTTTG